MVRLAEESPGTRTAEGRKTTKSGWGRGGDIEGFHEKVLSDLNLKG